jgi:predicted O-methyltransferase YrrM
MRGLFAGIDRAVVAKAVRDPRRALLRLVLRSRLAGQDVETDRRVLLELLSSRYQVDGEALGLEYRQSAFREWFLRRRVELARHPGPYRHGTTGQFGCEALYLLVRAARPRTIVETGVLYGASSAHLLAALARNGEGTLYSSEIGRRRDEPDHEYFVPDELRDRWKLVIGDSRRHLPGLMERCAPVDMFYHDSLHTYEHMVWEFGTALPYLGIGGLLASDDVLNPTDVQRIFRPGPFHSFCASGAFRSRRSRTSASRGRSWLLRRTSARPDRYLRVTPARLLGSSFQRIEGGIHDPMPAPESADYPGRGLGYP